MRKPKYVAYLKQYQILSEII